MELNKEIYDTLKECNIFPSDGVAYLLSLYFNLSPSVFTGEFKKRMNQTGIVVNTPTGLEWRIPLFKGAETAFSWVETEYVPLFKMKNPAKGGKVRESITRMKNLFAKNPDIRKEEVLEATRLYLANQDSKYIMFPHYFILKGKGVDKTQTLLEWIGKARDNKERAERRNSNVNTMR